MKNIIKSIFISLFPVLALLISISALWFIIQTGLFYNYCIGEFITATTIMIFFLKLFITPVARTKANPTYYTATVILGLLISVFFVTVMKEDINVLWVTLGLVLGWFAYLRWYSTLNNRTNTILKVGQTLPELKLTDVDGHAVSSTSFLGNPSIFLFYRGNWCPLCMAQIKEIAQDYKALEAQKVTTVLISPQPHKYTKNLANKFAVNFNFLIDKDNTVAKQLDIMSPNGIPMGFQVLGYDSNTVMPTVIITDRLGKIIFADLTDNYRVRPEPETFLRILDEHKL